MRRYLAVALLLLLAAGALAFFSTRSRSNQAEHATRNSEERTASDTALVPVDEASEVDGREGPALDPQAARTEVPVAGAPTFRVRCTEDHPVAAAFASWTPMRPEFLGTWVGWATQDWSAIEGASLECVADVDGILRFPQALDTGDGLPSALWITHERHLPRLVLLAADVGAASVPAVIELEHADGIQVRVTTRDGAPVEGARIEQLTPVPQSALADTFAPQARRVLRRETTSGPGGLAALPAWDGPLLLSAEFGQIASEVWIGAPRERIELILNPTFEVRGSVHQAAGAQIEGEQRIVCSAVSGTQLQELAVVPVRAGGIGPVVLPVLAVDGYDFRLEGWNVEIRAERIEPPAPGEVVHLDFEARVGLDLWTMIVDEEDHPIPGSEATITWEQDGCRVEARGHPREDGYAVVRGVPPGSASLIGRAPGYAQSGFGPFVVPQDPPVTFTLTLTRGWLIEGTVMHAGRSVEDFEIAFWDLDFSEYTTTPFRERPDGRFSILAETGRITHLVASAAGLGPSPVVTVQPGATASLTLELSTPVRGTGLVVDAASGEPLSEAQLQPFVAGEGGAISPFGPPRDVRADGTFDQTIFAVGRGMTRFSAPGYGTHWAETLGLAGETLAFGSIALTGRRDLTVRITSDEPFDPTQYWLIGSGADPIPQTSFAATGAVLVEQLSPGWYCLQVRGAAMLDYWVHLEPQEDWRIELTVGGGRTLRVEVDEGELPLDGLMVRAHVPGPGDRIVQLFAEVPPERVVEFRGVRPGEYGLSLLTHAGEEVGAGYGRYPDEEMLITDRLAPFGVARALFVVDGARHPIAGGSVTLVQAGNYKVTRCELDQAGRGELHGLEPGQFLARISHPLLGTHHNLPVNVSSRTEESLELVFVPDHSVELELRDGSEALSGVHCQLWEEHERFSISAATTDESGRVKWEHLGAGGYSVWISHPDVWSTKPRVAAGRSGQASEVQVRRLGDVQLELRDADGAVLVGREPELTSLEFGVSVGDWVQSGRVTSSSGGLRSDATGTLMLSGLPRGRYAWSLDGAQGAFDVLPATIESVRLVVP